MKDINYQLMVSVLGSKKERVNHLLAEGASPDEQDGSGMSSVIATGYQDDPEITQAVITKSKEPNQADVFGWQGMAYATYAQNYRSKEIMLLNGLECSADISGIAIDKKDHHMIDLEFKYNQHMNKTTSNNEYLVIKSVSSGEILVVESILKTGVNIDVQGKGGNTAAHKATCMGREDLVEIVLEYNPNLTITNDQGFTARDYAINYDLKKIEVMIDNKIRIHDRDR